MIPKTPKSQQNPAPKVAAKPDAASNDPYIYASVLSSLMQERNPIQVIVGDLTRMMGTIVNMGKNRQMAQVRINQLQEQAERVESAISSATHKPTGSRFDRIR